jgi:hypothetical protein
LLGFEYIKELYLDDHDFGAIYDTWKVSAKDKYFRHDRFLFKENKLCVPNCSLRELLMHGGGLMGHFGITKTLKVLHEYFYWPNKKRDVQRMCDRCITCRQAKSRVMPHKLYTPFLVP